MSLWTKLSDSLQSSIFAAVKEGDLEKVESFLKGNPDLVFDADDAGWTPLHYAAHWGHKEVVESLLDTRAEVNAQDNDGITPLHCAAAQGYKDVAELLLADKARVNAQDNEGVTPLHFAAEEGRKDVVDRCPAASCRIASGRTLLIGHSKASAKRPRNQSSATDHFDIVAGEPGGIHK